MKPGHDFLQTEPASKVFSYTLKEYSVRSAQTNQFDDAWQEAHARDVLVLVRSSDSDNVREHHTGPNSRRDCQKVACSSLAIATSIVAKYDPLFRSQARIIAHYSDQPRTMITIRTSLSCAISELGLTM